MLRMDIEFTVNGEKHERTFRTNESGACLFTGVSVNNQISCDSGFQILKNIKKYIRWYIVMKFGDNGEADLSRIKYTYISPDFKLE